MNENVDKMYHKYPHCFMFMYEHSKEENAGYGDSISVIFSKIMSNVTHPDQYWMPENSDGFTKEEILKDFASLKIGNEQ